KPSILILDEPINGLDPAGIIDIRQLLLRLAEEEGVTIFMSSHLLDEVTRICTTIGIIHDGRLVKEVTKTELENQLEERLRLKVDDRSAAEILLHKKGISTETCNQFITSHHKKAIYHPEKIAQLLIDHGLCMYHLEVARESLEDYFLRIIG